MPVVKAIDWLYFFVCVVYAATKCCIEVSLILILHFVNSVKLRGDIYYSVIVIIIFIAMNKEDLPTPICMYANIININQVCFEFFP